MKALDLFFFHNDPTESYYAKEWIWPKLNTVNFHMELENGVCRLSYKGKNEQLSLLKEFAPTILFLEKISDQVSNQMEFEGSVKCSYDPAVGDWVCYEVNPDFRVDSIERVFDVYEIFAQKITVEDLLKRFASEEVVYQTPSASADVSPETTGTKRTHSYSFENSPEERRTKRKC